MSKEIPLTKGMVAIVDDEDWERLSQFKWAAQGRTPYFYAGRMIYQDGIQRLEMMGRAIAQPPPDKVVHYKNRNTLDNRRENLEVLPLRAVLKYSPPTHGSSRFRGVYWAKEKGRWRAMIRTNGNKRHLGYHKDEEQAARAYDRAAYDHYGQGAELNFPEELKSD